MQAHASRKAIRFQLRGPTIELPDQTQWFDVKRFGNETIEYVRAETWSPQPFGSPVPAVAYSALFYEVRVNAVTGEVRVARFLCCFDCGRILNAKTAASQLRGRIIMGIGLALTENTMIDERNGRIMNPSLAEYHVSVHLDVPAIDVRFIDLPDPHAPMGAQGIGEIDITGVGAAIANAVFNTTVIRTRDLPITLEKLP